MDSFSVQLRENSVVVANISKIVDINAAAVQDCATVGFIDGNLDTVHGLRRREEGKHCQVIMQFTMRHHRHAFWKLSKKQDFCKAD